MLQQYDPSVRAAIIDRYVAETECLRADNQRQDQLTTAQIKAAQAYNQRTDQLTTARIKAAQRNPWLAVIVIFLLLAATVLVAWITRDPMTTAVATVATVAGSILVAVFRPRSRAGNGATAESNTTETTASADPE
jgi:uncharacterized membrane protein YgcG